MRSTRILQPLAAVLFSASVVHAIEEVKPALPAKPAAKPAGLNLQDGDRFIFIGDSITHQCLYTQYVEDFYYTRFPNRRIHFRNAGVSGDRASDALARFDDDIARFKPTVATVLLGMNDGSYKDFDQATFDTYAKDMTTLLDKLDALKCRVILMGPTMFDHQAWDKRVKEKPEYAKGRNVNGYNAVLAYYAAWQREVARQRGYQFVDMWSDLNNLTAEARVTDPAMSLIPDAIHPDAPGQMIMAYSVLKTLGEPRGVTQVSGRIMDGQWKLASGSATLTSTAGEVGKSLTFDLQPRALPWVVGEDADLGFKMTRAGHTMGQEAYTIAGFEPGRYDLIINGQTVGAWDQAGLARHAEFEEDKDSPTWQQSAAVAALNKQRSDEAIRPLRNLYGQRKGRLRAAQAKGDMQPFEAWLPEFQKQQAELEAKAKGFEDQIYQLNQPKALHVEIKPSAVKPAGRPGKGAAKGKGKGKQPAIPAK